MRRAHADLNIPMRTCPMLRCISGQFFYQSNVPVRNNSHRSKEGQKRDEKSAPRRGLLMTVGQLMEDAENHRG